MSLAGIVFLSLLIFFYFIGALISMKIILENRDPSKTMAWLLIFILLPGIGLVIYAIFGRNLRKRKILKTQKLASSIKENNLFENIKAVEDLVRLEKKSIDNDEILLNIEGNYAKKRVIKLLLNTGMFPFTNNNSVEVYRDGNEKFDQLIKDIKEAKDHIHLEYFIIKDSNIGRQIKDLLIKKSKEGVKVRIIYDDVGCWRFWFNRKFLMK